MSKSNTNTHLFDIKINNCKYVLYTLKFHRVSFCHKVITIMLLIIPNLWMTDLK